LISLREKIDTTTATGRAFLAIMGAIAQMERELKAERTAAGRAAAKARGRTGGRPRTDPDTLEQARILYRNSDKTAAEVCGTLGIGRRTLFTYLAQVKHQASAQSPRPSRPLPPAARERTWNFTQFFAEPRIGAYLSELFPSRVRGSGQGFCYNFGRAVGSICPALVGYLSDSMPLGLAIGYMAVGAYLLVILSALTLPETKGHELSALTLPETRERELTAHG
jgi:hypothetical protein